MSIQGEKLKAIADAIREKDGTTEHIVANDFATRIRAISGSEDLTTELDTQDGLLNNLEAEINKLPDYPSKGKGEYFVRVIDYDGTVLDEQYLNTGDVYTLPEPPSHNGLTFQNYSCSQEIVDNTITVTGKNVMVGATYVSSSGLNEFDVELTKSIGLDVTLNMNGTKDWGDGTSDDLTTHSYSDYGKYTIKCDGIMMTASSSSGLFGQSQSAKNYYCISIRLNETTDIGNYTLSNCAALKSIVIPRGIKKLGYEAFKNCYSLIGVVVPDTITSFSSYVFYYCSALKNVVIPYSVKELAGYTFNYCHSLTNIVLGANVSGGAQSVLGYCYSLTNVDFSDAMTEIFISMFSSCYALPRIDIPSKVTNINSSAFSTCYRLKLYNFSLHKTVPTLYSTNAFSNINKAAKIVVPDALYDEWIVATNWTTYADYIYKASEVNL